MKRCPKCEFIYEDDQNLCDMDGVRLVFDGRSLPNLHALAPVQATAIGPRTHWRHRTFPAMAGLILVTVLSLVYFVSTQQPKPSATSVPGSAPITVSVPTAESGPATSVSTTPNSDSTTAATDTNQTPPPPTVAELNAATTKPDKSKAEKKSDPPKASTPAPKSASKPTTTQRQPEEPKKDESKVGSILKKTGRLLKKPFKL